MPGPSGTILPAGIDLDLSQLVAKLNALQQQIGTVTSQIANAAGRVTSVINQSNKAQAFVGRLETRFKSFSKGLAKTGLQIGAASVIGELESEGEVGFLGGLAGSVATGAIFGGPQGAAVAATFYLVSKLQQEILETVREVRKLEKSIKEEPQKRREFYDKVEQRLIKEELDREEQRRTWSKRLEEEFRKKYTNELYDTVSMIAAEEVSRIQ